MKQHPRAVTGVSLHRGGDRPGLFRFWRPAATGLAIFAGVAALALVGPGFYPRRPWDLVGRPFLPPLSSFPLGTDTLGRDLAADVISGARVSLLIALVATAMAVVIGVVIGALAGYQSRGVGALIRVIEFFQAIPSFLLAPVLIAIFQPSLWRPSSRSLWSPGRR